MATRKARSGSRRPRKFRLSDDKRFYTQPLDGDLGKERTRTQIDKIVQAHRDADIPIAVHERGPDDPDYLYRPDRIITRDGDAARVYRALGLDRTFDKRFPDATRRPAGLHTINLDNGRDALEVLDELDERLGEGVAAPDHLFHVCITWCGATEPLIPTGGQQMFAAADPQAGSLSRVSIVDTGLRADVADAHPDRLSGVEGDPEPPSIGHYTSHGTFIAGVVRQYAPAAEIRIESAMNVGGTCFETELVAQLEEALDWVPDVINLSGGTRTRGGLPPLGFQVFYEQRLRHLGGTVLVAAAGNDGDRGPFWPAAFPWVVAVGALDATRAQRAGFTNSGSWVDVYAPGEDVLSTYTVPGGEYVYEEPPLVGVSVTFPDGLARWSGTSFAAPMVCGLVAARMTTSGESGADAASSLLQTARANALPGVGAVVT